MANDELMRLADRIAEKRREGSGESIWLATLELDIRTLAQRAPQNGAVPEVKRAQDCADLDGVAAAHWANGWNACRTAMLAAAPAPEAVMINGLTEAETAATASVMGLKPEAERAKGEAVCADCGWSGEWPKSDAGRRGACPVCTEGSLVEPGPPPAGQPEGVEALHPSTIKWIQQEIETAEAFGDDDGEAEDQRRVIHLQRLLRFASRLTSAPKAVQTDGEGVLPALQVGSLPTLNQDEYPALGDWWVQLWAGDEVFARVYGPSPDDAHQRATEAARRLASAQQSVGSEQRGDSARYEVLNGSEVGDA